MPEFLFLVVVGFALIGAYGLVQQIRLWWWRRRFRR